jgi:hypothetical protein
LLIAPLPPPQVACLSDPDFRARIAAVNILGGVSDFTVSFPTSDFTVSFPTFPNASFYRADVARADRRLLRASPRARR